MTLAEGTCSVEFSPDGLRVPVSRGTTILDAARRAGVPIDTMCGGEGTCGKCRVIVRSGDIETQGAGLLDEEESRAGWVLACQARVAGDAKVEIPPESRVRFEEVEFAEPEAGAARIKPDRPLVEVHDAAVAVPSLEFNRADLDRLILALPKLPSGETYGMEISAARELPAALRDSSHRVKATTAWRGPVTEIIGAGAAAGLGVALDVGTTTLVAELIDLSSGRILGSASKYNSQAAYGPDVIRRILWATEQPGGLERMNSCVVSDVNALIGSFEDRLKVKRSEIGAIVAAGNTTMVHLLLALNPEWIRREPYVGAVYRPDPVCAADLGLSISKHGLLYCVPCVSGFVGGDIVAGVLATGLAEAEKPRMLVDMGTNGEVVIGNREWLVCASASAGPAFEGAGTRHGMRAMIGAIDHVGDWRDPEGFELTTKGGKPPAGLCGTAYIDLLVRLLGMGVVDKTGRFNADRGSDRLRPGPDALPEFVVVRKGERGASQDIAITQGDLNNLLRAKGAIYAAIKLLLKSLGLKARDLEKLTVAGAFGSHMDIRSAISIGLLPDEDIGKLNFAGNTSLAGARAALLSRAGCVRAAALADGMTYYELSTDPGFMEEFTSACFLPHTNIEEFPSVSKMLRERRDRP